MHKEKLFLAATLAVTLGAFPVDKKVRLQDFGYNRYSQFGEDGIIQKIFEKIGTTSKRVIEFGAADGFMLSNTANLWTKNEGWFGILIEYSLPLYQQAVKNVAPYNCRVIHRKVGVSKQDSLEAILKEQGLDVEPIDLLSIDIDGNDYHVLQSLEYVRPRVIICEYNVSIPAHLDVYPDVDNYIGCSVAALERVAREKGYFLVALTDTNCFFVRNEEMHNLADLDTDREHPRIDKYISYVISDYAGRYKVIGAPDFRDAWGWRGEQSRHTCKGCRILTAKVIRE